MVHLHSSDCDYESRLKLETSRTKKFYRGLAAKLAQFVTRKTDNNYFIKMSSANIAIKCLGYADKKPDYCGWGGIVLRIFYHVHDV